MNIDQYINKWVDTTVNLSEWEQHRNIDHWEIIVQMDLDNELIEEIENHQSYLFHSAVKGHVDWRLEQLNEKPELLKKEIIIEHLRLIDLFTKSVEVNPILIELLSKIILFSVKNYVGVLMAWQVTIHGEDRDFRTNFNIGQPGSLLYGNYYIAEILRLYKGKISALLNNGISSVQTDSKTNKLKVPQIALIHVYEGFQITRENAGEIAAKHGYTSKNSGEGLFQDYTNYCSTANRKGKPTPCTPKKLKNKIELFESVVNYLSDKNKQRAIDEINILKTIFEN